MWKEASDARRSAIEMANKAKTEWLAKVTPVVDTMNHLFRLAKVDGKVLAHASYQSETVKVEQVGDYNAKLATLCGCHFVSFGGVNFDEVELRLVAGASSARVPADEFLPNLTSNLLEIVDPRNPATQPT